MRRLAPSFILLLVLTLLVPAVADAKKHKGNGRHGGKVSEAWPRDKSEQAPDDPMAAWLAQQVGPVATSAKHSHARRSTAHAAAYIPPSGGNTISIPGLSLVRSFEIPTTDPSYDRLANLSWTYDNALAALAFIDRDYRSQAEQLLDQLKALQLKDGSLAFSYDVKTGAGSGQIRSNALAWVGIAAVAYRQKYGNDRYDGLVAGLADYLLKSRRTDGLVLGGPDVQWVSTQHNILMAEFFRSAYKAYGDKPIASGITGTQLNAAYNLAGNAIIGKLIVQAGAQAYFVEGLNDPRQALDTQTLGSVFLSVRGDGRAKQVADWFNSTLYLTPRIAQGFTWSGYKPFVGPTAPNIIWSEGTVQGDWAIHRVELSSAYAQADQAVKYLSETTAGGTVGPLGASTAFNDKTWGDFPSWRASAAASWMLILANGGNALFAK
jgi:hypothetical protein